MVHMGTGGLEWYWNAARRALGFRDRDWREQLEERMKQLLDAGDAWFRQAKGGDPPRRNCWQGFDSNAGE